MIILSHRGYWKEIAEKNLPVAFHRSFDLGFGTETDVRDCAGRLLISHDMPSGAEMPLAEMLAIYGARNHLPLAVNIKCDGLTLPLKAAFDAAGVTNWFVFDMAVPDMRAYLAAGIPVFTRMSEVERNPVWLEDAAGVWLDGFEAVWYDVALIEGLLAKGKRVCIVSSELHKREHVSLWAMLKPLFGRDGLMLCTDLPEEAVAYFNATHK